MPKSKSQQNKGKRKNKAFKQQNQKPKSGKVSKVETMTTEERDAEIERKRQAKWVEQCGAYAEFWQELDKPKGWKGCSLPKGHEGNHTDKPEQLGNGAEPLPAEVNEDEGDYITDTKVTATFDPNSIVTKFLKKEG